MIDNEKIMPVKKAYKRAGRMLAIGLICLMVLTGIVLYLLISYKSKAKDPTYLDDIIVSNDTDKTERYASLRVEGYYEFEADKNYAWCIVDDGDFWYIIKIKVTYLDKLEKIKKDKGTIYGFTDAINGDIRDMVLDYFKYDDTSRISTIAGFTDMFGDVYLDVEVTPIDMILDRNGFLGLLVFVLLVAGCIMTGIGTYLNLRFFKSLKKYGITKQEFYNDIGNYNAVLLPLSRIYITPKYIYGVESIVHVLKPADAVWVFKTVHQTNYVRDYDYISVGLRDGRMLRLATVTVSQEKKAGGRTIDEDMVKLVDALIEVNPELIVGHTPDNKSLFYARVQSNRTYRG